MRTGIKAITGLAASVAIIASLTACSTTTAPAESATTEAPAAEAGTYASGDENTLIFATLPDHEGADQDAQPIADWIAEITGKDVQLFEATDYSAVIQGLAAGKIDIAQISAFTYYQSKNAGADIEPIGAQITKDGAEPGYFSVALANPASSATSLEDFAGQKVCFVNPESTSGFLVPNAQLLKAGVTIPEADQVFGEKHPATAALVAEGAQCQVGFAQDVDADPLVESGALKEIARYQVPAAPIVLQNALPQSVKDEIFAEIADSTQASLTGAGIELNDFLKENWFGFGAVDDAYYDTITAVCEELPDVEACKA